MMVFLLAVVASAWLMVGMLIFARRKPGYSHIKHTISELGEVGASDQGRVAYGLFLPIGSMMLVAAALIEPESRAAASLTLALATGYLVSVVFPCDPGSPIVGNARQAMHNLGGAVQYIGGGFALMVLAETQGQPFKIAGAIVLSTAAALTILPATFARGLVQRIGEFCLFGGAMLAFWRFWSAA